MVALVRPDVARQAEWRAMAEEFGRAHIEGAAMEMTSLDRLGDRQTFADWVDLLLANERGERLPDGYVPGSTRWIVDDADRLVGFMSIRHQLNQHLLEVGGHIGYAIRPSERGKGYATAATALALLECRRLGIDRVLITCDDTNVASATVIERNGGLLEDIRGVKRRYWVDLTAGS